MNETELRALYAGLAMQATLAKYGKWETDTSPKKCVDIANSLIAELNKSEGACTATG